MRIEVLWSAIALLTSEAAELVPHLDSQSSVAQSGKPWGLAFNVLNQTGKEMYSEIPDSVLLIQGSPFFTISNSKGELIPFHFNKELDAVDPSWYRLIGPGQSSTDNLAIFNRYVHTGADEQGSSACRHFDECMQQGALPLPADIYRLRWLHQNGANSFTTPEDRAKVWFGEVWSNTLIIQTTEKEPVKVGLDVDPDTLNFKSEGKWITAYLSTGTKLDLLTRTTKFMGTVASDKIEWSSGQVNEWQAVIKFPRSLVIDLLKDIRGWELDGYMKVFVSAESGDKMFWGDDKIRILEDPGNPPPNPPSPPGQDKKKSPRR